MKILRYLLPAAGLLAMAAHADDLAFASSDQAALAAAAPDIAAAFEFKPLGPAAATGVLGFSVGAYGGITPVRDAGAWRRLTGRDPGNLSVVGIDADKGLPLGFDVGGFVARLPDAAGTVYGGQLRYALLEGSAVNPAVALRASYTGASGLRSFNYRGYGVDLSVSKGLPLLTPYAGVGYVWTRVSPKAGTGLSRVDVDRPKGFVGLRFAPLGVIGVTAEYDRIGADNVYNLRFGVSL